MCETFTDHTDFESDTSNANNILDLQAFANCLDARGAMRAANRHGHACCGSFPRDSERSHRPIPLQKGAESWSCIVKFLRRWLVYDSQDGRTVDDQSDLHGKFSTMFNELSSAVHGIDHPNVRFR